MSIEIIRKAINELESETDIETIIQECQNHKYLLRYTKHGNHDVTWIPCSDSP